MMRHVFALLIIGFAVLVSQAGAQGTRGSLTGTVTDPNGAVVPGAKVTATRLETNQATTVTSDSLGAYNFPVLEVGTYRLDVEQTGFRAFTQSGITLQVEQRVRVDVQLQVGNLSERIEITAEAPLTQPESSSLGQVIDSKRIVDLPLNGRNPLELMRLSTGVNLLATAFLDTRNFNLTSVSINGGQGGTSSILIDGGAVNLPGRNEYSVAPNVDAVSEFKVQTNSFSAEFGLTGGGVITMVTKSGTNEFHGGLFEFLRNDKLDANGWTNNSRRLIKPPIRYNQFGGSFGGPVILPRLYNGKDKTFFFFNYEGIRYRSTTEARLVRVPTAEERAGDFSNTWVVDPRNRQIIRATVFDPNSTQQNPNGAGFIRAPFANARIPQNRLDSIATKALGFIPLPNRPPDDLTGLNNFVGTPALATDNDQFTVRIDHQLTPNNRLSGRYSHTDAAATGTPPLFSPTNIADPEMSLQERFNRNAFVSLTSTIRPTLLNELRASVTRMYLRSAQPGFGQGASEKLGLPRLIPGDLFPRFNIADVNAIGNRTDQLALRGQTVPQIINTSTWVKGRHQLKFGADWRTFLYGNYQPGAISGNFNFNRDLTGDPQLPGPTGHGLATFLTGAVQSGSLNVGIANMTARIYTAFFAQDDFKINRKLTLNLGLRYDIFTSPAERFDRWTNFNPTATNPLTGAPGVMQFAKVDFGRTVFETDYNNFGPRIGFAYDPWGNQRTVIRGGYGMFYYHGGALELPATEGYSTATNFASTLGPQYAAFQLSAGPATVDQPSGSRGGPATFLGNNVTHTETNSKMSYAQQWNFSIQRIMPFNILAEVAYAGNRSVNGFGFGWDLNQLDPQHLSLGLALDNAVPNPYFGIIPTGTLSGRTITRQQSLRPYQAYLNVNVNNPRLGSSIYHSMQLRVEKRYAAGFTVLGSYTLGKLIGDIGRNLIDFTTTGGAPQSSIGCGQNTKFDRRSCRSVEPQDLTHNAVISTVYDVPFGTGKRYFSKGAPRYILGDWQVNGIVTLRSGLPLVIRGANNRAADRPNWIRDANLPDDQKSIARWFDTGAFAAPPLFTYGNAPRTMPNLRGPGFASIDLSLFKNIPLTERFRLQFRAEFFNALNRTNFDLPNASFTSSAFGVINTAGEPRRTQLALKFNF